MSGLQVTKTQIKRVLDAGAKGIIIPMINSKQQAIKAIEATRYAPYGTRCGVIKGSKTWRKIY